MLPQGIFGIVGVTIVLGLLLLGIEEVGMQVQNPFGYDLSDLPLEEYVEELVNVLAKMHARYCDPTSGGVREHAAVNWRLSSVHMLSSRGDRSVFAGVNQSPLVCLTAVDRGRPKRYAKQPRSGSLGADHVGYTAFQTVREVNKRMETKAKEMLVHAAAKSSSLSNRFRR